jgi:transcriptional regulator with XRE-family HTH domain
MPKHDIYKEVGLHVRARRLLVGMTLEDLSDHTGLSASSLGQVERDVKKASLETLARVARALDVRVSALFDRASPLAALPWNKRIETIMRKHPDLERRLLLSSLRHLSLGLKGLRVPRSVIKQALAKARRKKPAGRRASGS